MHYVLTVQTSKGQVSAKGSYERCRRLMTSVFLTPFLDVEAVTFVKENHVIAPSKPDYLEYHNPQVMDAMQEEWSVSESGCVVTDRDIILKIGPFGETGK